MDLFDLLSDKEDFSSIFGPTVPEQAPKKEATKAKKNCKKSKSDGKGNSGDDFLVKLPVTVRARGFRIQLGESGEKKISEIFTELNDIGYTEVQIDGMDAAYESETDTLYICSGNCRSSELSELAEFENGCFTVEDGMTKFTASPEQYPDFDSDELSVDMMLEGFIKVNPIYDGAVPCATGSILYPLFKVHLAPGDKLNPCASVFYDGSLHPIDEGCDTAEQLITSTFGELSSCSAHLSANLDKTVYFVSFTKKGFVRAAKKFSEKATEKKQATKKYPLPLHVYITTWNGSYDLQCSDFPGKEKVSIEDIKEFFVPQFKMFSDKSRKLDSVYIKENNTLSLMFVSGTKGAATADVLEGNESRLSYGSYMLLRTIKDLREALQLPVFHGNLISQSTGSIRVENLPHGIFLGTLDSRTGHITEVSFQRKLPRIPYAVLAEIIARFKEDLSIEAWAKICYNNTSNRFFTVYGTGQASADMIHYQMPTDGLIDNPSIIQVMELHSHNRMSAIFSPTDDRDEIYPGIFGVIGRLDKEIPDILLRAGLEGTFTNLEIGELFDI